MLRTLRSACGDRYLPSPMSRSSSSKNSKRSSICRARNQMPPCSLPQLLVSGQVSQAFAVMCNGDTDENHADVQSPTLTCMSCSGSYSNRFSCSCRMGGNTSNSTPLRASCTPSQYLTHSHNLHVACCIRLCAWLKQQQLIRTCFLIAERQGPQPWHTVLICHD